MKTRKLFLLISFLSLILSGCNNVVTSSANNTNGKAKISISLTDSYSRTAIPVFDWDDFTYEMIAVQNPGESTQKEPETLFEDRTYENLVRGIELDAAKYKFVLNAYKDSQKVLSGIQTVDLSSGNVNLSFLMYSVDGGKGSAAVKIIYPMENPVSKIVAYTSSEIFDEQPESGQSVKELSSRIVSGKMESVYEVSNLNSNREQYAIIKFYDSNNALVYSCAESLIILGGCVSRSTVEIKDEDWHTYICTVTLKKDDEGWASSGKTVSLVNKTNSTKVYPLSDSAGGKFKASVAEGIYYVYVNNENTGIEFNSVNKNVNVNYYTVSMDAVKKCTMNPVSGGINMEENIAVVQEGKEFSYKLSLSKGYETSSLVVKHNGTAIPGVEFEKNVTIDSVNQPVKILAEGINPITYTISYSDNNVAFEPRKVANLAYWYKYGTTYTPPVSFTAEDVVVLPAIENIRKDNNYFDAWTDSKGNTVIDTKGIYENLVLNANWKDAPKVDDENKVIYANGFNLLIKASDNKNTQTLVYIDYNGNGIKENDDTQITCNNISTGINNDFTGYELRAGSMTGDYIPKSDFTFTMTGGNISGIYGLNSKTQKYKNKSTLNISGTAVIGKIVDQSSKVNADSTTSTYAKSVTGIMLDTLSAERVYIVNQMNNLNDAAKSPYAITCVTENNYEIDREHIVAEIANSNFATLANFTCWNVNAEDPDKVVYKQILLSHKEENVNSVTRTYIRMADDSGIVLPKADEIIWDEVNNEFNLGADSVQKPCSVFSLSVENGTFRVNERTTITNNKTDADLAIEKTLTYMAQPTPITYVEKLSFEENYVYMQVLSSADLLTPASVNNFLSQVFFKKIDGTKAIKVSVNIETVPAKYILGTGDGAGGSEFKYFNGSFYKRYYKANDTTDGYSNTTLDSGDPDNIGKIVNLISWTNSYKKAKQKTFNGLKGYLMNITSEVENNYIYDTFYKLNPDQLSWAGGAAFIPAMTTPGMITGENVLCWDQDTTALLADNATINETTGLNSKWKANKWYWQAGPEAGMCFWGTAVANDEESAANGKIEGVFERWNNSKYLHRDLWDTNLETTDPTKLLKGREGEEPNTPKTTTVNKVVINTTDEPCLQFLSGKLVTTKGTYLANGFWNNLKDSNSQSDGYGSTGYIVEFTPYETEYGKQVANYQAIKRTSTY
ncbi:MAG: hypothetical protein MJ174_03125 [Treponema sp.]|nr:hypothetical protein [Treponema sp.]